jgi:hypothetical protein
MILLSVFDHYTEVTTYELILLSKDLILMLCSVPRDVAIIFEFIDYLVDVSMTIILVYLFSVSVMSATSVSAILSNIPC